MPTTEIPQYRIDVPIPELLTKLDYFQVFNEIQFLKHPEVLSKLYPISDTVEERKSTQIEGFVRYQYGFKPRDSYLEMEEGVQIYSSRCLKDSVDLNDPCFPDFLTRINVEKILNLIEVAVIEAQDINRISGLCLNNPPPILSFNQAINWEESFKNFSDEALEFNQTPVDKHSVAWVGLWNCLIGYLLVAPPHWFQCLPEYEHSVKSKNFPYSAESSQKTVFDAIVIHPGSTNAELAAITGYSLGSIGRFVVELRKNNWINSKRKSNKSSAKIHYACDGVTI
jgi:hypothetical protein